MTRHIKRLFLVLLFLGCSVSQAWAATLYLRDNATTWAAASSWSNVGAVDNTDSGPCTASDTCIAELLSGNVSISATAAAGSFSTTAGNGSWGGTLTHDAGINWTVAGSITFNAGMTYTPTATSTVTLSATNTLTSAGKLFPLMVLSAGTTTLGDNLSFMASKVITLTFNGNLLNINGKTVSGNSAINRVFIRSNTLGTARTITTTTGTFDAADFRDITASTAIDLSAATNYSGNAGGNTNITFTTAATQTYTGGTGNWSTGASWTSRVPLPQDDVLMSGVTGGTITADMLRLGKSIDWTSAAGTPAFALGNAVSNYGSLNLISGMTFTGSFAWTFEGRGSFTLTSAAKSFPSSFVISMVGGTMTLQDALTTVSTYTLTNGTFTTGNFNVTTPFFSSTNTTTRAVNMGSGTWSLNKTSGSVWDTTIPTALTLNQDTSTISITDVGSSTKTFAGGGKTFNNLSITGGGSGAIIFTGSNTFANLPQITGGTKTLQFTAATTTTFTGGTSFGNGTNVITISSVTGATHTLSKSSGTIAADYLSLTNSIATGGAAWYAGANSTNVSGNTGWIFTAVPVVASTAGSFGGGEFGENMFGIKAFGREPFS